VKLFTENLCVVQQTGILCFLNRDKKILLGYVASVEKALKTGDSGSIGWPSGELLPAQLGVVVSSKRPSASLVAVKNLVTTFVSAHNRLVHQLASAGDHGNQLQLELC